MPTDPMPPAPRGAPMPAIGELVAAFCRSCSHLADKGRDHGAALEKRIQRLSRGADMDPKACMEVIDGELKRLSDLDPAFAGLLLSHAAEGLATYAGAVLRLDLGGLSRAEAAPALAVRLFLPWAAGLARGMATLGPTPPLDEWARPGKATVRVLNWWVAQQDAGIPTLAARIAGNEAGKRTLEGNLYAWRDGGPITVRSALSLYAGSNGPLARWMLLARAWDQIVGSLDAPAQDRAGRTWRALLKARPDGPDLEALQRELADAGRGGGPMGSLPADLGRLTNLAGQKRPGDAASADATVKALEAAGEGAGVPAWLAPWCRARYHLLMGAPAAALGPYGDAFASARYRSGPAAKDILNELLVVAACLGRDRPQRDWGAWAAAMGLTPHVRHPGPAFNHLVPAGCLYAEATPPARRDLGGIGGLLMVGEEWDRWRPDLRHPDRRVKGFGSVARPQLAIAAKLGKADAVRALLEAGASPEEAAADGGTPLLHAIQARAGDCVDLLLPRTGPAALDRATRHGRHYPLGVAVEQGDAGLVARLLSAGASANPAFGPGEEMPRPDDSPLYQAVLRCVSPAPGPSDLMEGAALLDAVRRGPPLPFSQGHAFLEDQARALGGQLVASLANPRHRQIYAAVEAMMFPGPAGADGRRQVVAALLAGGADPNARHDHKHGFTPFLCAAEGGDADLVGLLLRHGADLGSTTMAGQTAVHLALWKGQHEVASLLLAAADPALRRRLATAPDTLRGTTPLQWAVLHLGNGASEFGHVVRTLVAAGANPEAGCPAMPSARVLAGRLAGEARAVAFSALAARPTGP